MTAYFDGKVHTNELEKYLSLRKRGLNGNYFSVRYLDEHAFRYNNLATEYDTLNDEDRFARFIGFKNDWWPIQAFCSVGVLLA